MLLCKRYTGKRLLTAPEAISLRILSRRKLLYVPRFPLSYGTSGLVNVGRNNTFAMPLRATSVKGS
jgi:hypothetical protein